VSRDECRGEQGFRFQVVRSRKFYLTGANRTEKFLTITVFSVASCKEVTGTIITTKSKGENHMATQTDKIQGSDAF
jgi:hypothetical protein